MHVRFAFQHGIFMSHVSKHISSEIMKVIQIFNPLSFREKQH